ncbi:MAG TPA: ABC transporter ATP-binding protein [Candidatus Ozemobacteraceae bacterium]|nr:ABC transporter ATP-binding protein [Candidatus Ozemobacteraceae bacterium]
MTELVAAEEITKRVGWWKPETIVDRVSLSLCEGEIMGMLGPNGAGKTTTMKMLLGLTSITSGVARMFGAPVPSASSRVGVGFLPESIQHPGHLTVYEYIRFHALLSELKVPGELVGEQLRRVELWEHRDRLLIECSKGMRQRADIARLLMKRARLILLDEPFSGLDPCGQVMLRELLLSLKQEGIAILVNSHASGILEDVCDRVCLMNRGRVVLGGSLAELLRTSQTRVVASFPESGTALETFVAAHSAIPHRRLDRGEIEFLAGEAAIVNDLLRDILRGGGMVTLVAPVTLTLEQLFLRELSERGDAANERRG